MKRYTFQDSPDSMGSFYLCTDVDALLAQCEEALASITRIGDYEPDCNKCGEFLTARDIASSTLTTIRAAREGGKNI
jgi:hypothetical protein